MHRLIAAADELWGVVADEGFDARCELIGLSDVDDPDRKGAISFVELDGHPSEKLLGFTALDLWWAVGLLATGWAAPMEGDATHSYGAGEQRPSAHPDAVRVRMLALVDRDGTTVSRAVCDNGRTIDEAGDGFIVDLLRRTIGVPTPPPTSRTAELITGLWLMNIEGAAGNERCDRARRLSWSQVARLHPAMDLLKKSGHRPAPALLVQAARAMHNVLSWELVRQQCIDHAWLAPALEPDVARWMDEGILSRYVLTEIPPLTELRRHVGRLLRPEVAAHLDAALSEMTADPSAAA